MAESAQYPGINAHLNSFLQQPDGGWESFHAEHIIQIRRALDTILPENYYAIAENSLQISAAGLDRSRRTRPDVSVYQRSASTKPLLNDVTATTPTLVMPLPETLLEDEDDTLTAIGIYQMVAGQMPGELVTRIEVLSPSNKPGGDHARYTHKRLQSLRSGVNLIEMGYLHQTRPIITRIPSYPDRAENATPYYILVSNPHPTLTEGAVALYAVAINQALPRLRLPLASDDSTILDLQKVYGATITETRAFQLMIDLSELPANFEAYTAVDQAHIRQIMA